MTTTLGPTTTESIAGAAVDWGTPENAAASNDTYATASLSFVNQDSDPLRATVFDFSAIPATAIVSGLAVLVEGNATTTASLNWCELLSDGVVIGARDNTDKALTASDAEYTYGGDGTLWGGVARSHLNSDFQVQTAAQATGTSTVSVDAITVVVYWYPGAVGRTRVRPQRAR